MSVCSKPVCTCDCCSASAVVEDGELSEDLPLTDGAQLLSLFGHLHHSLCETQQSSFNTAAR